MTKFIRRHWGALFQRIDSFVPKSLEERWGHRKALKDLRSALMESGIPNRGLSQLELRALARRVSLQLSGYSTRFLRGDTLRCYMGNWWVMSSPPPEDFNQAEIRAYQEFWLVDMRIRLFHSSAQYYLSREDWGLWPDDEDAIIGRLSRRESASKNPVTP